MNRNDTAIALSWTDEQRRINAEGARALLDAIGAPTTATRRATSLRDQEVAGGLERLSRDVAAGILTPTEQVERMRVLALAAKRPTLTLAEILQRRVPRPAVNPLAYSQDDKVGDAAE